MGSNQESLLTTADFQIERLTMTLSKLRSTRYNLVGLAEPCSECKNEYPLSLEGKLNVVSGLIGQIQDETNSIASIIGTNGLDSCTTNCAESC